MRGYGHFRQGRTGRRGKLVQVEPRLSITAASADQWIAVRPGTEGVFGLGVAAVIVAEGLFDKEFVAEHTVGLEDGIGTGGGQRRGLRSLLEREYPLERVAEETGVPANVILGVARECAAARRSVAVGPRRGPLLPGSLHGHLVAQTLNALLGSVDSEGGVLIAEETPLAPWPALPRMRSRGGGGAAPPGWGRDRGFSLLLSDPERLAEAILARSPYPVEALRSRGGSDLRILRPDRFAAALEDPWSSRLRTCPTTPRSTPTGFCQRRISWSNGSSRRRRKASPIRLSVSRSWRCPGRLRCSPVSMSSLARPRSGTGVAAAFPWKDVQSLLRAEMEGLYEQKRGAIMGTAFDEAWVRMMEGQAGGRRVIGPPRSCGRSRRKRAAGGTPSTITGTGPAC